MAQFTRLTLPELQTIADAYGLGPLAGFKPLWAGTINSNFRLDTSAGPLFLRVNEGKLEEDVAYEAELVSHVAARGVPTPRPVAALDGRPYAAVGGRLLTLFPWREGHHPEPPTPDDARAAGSALARLHLAGEGFPRRRESRYAPARIRERAAGIAAPVPELPELRRELEALPDDAELPRGLIHGDLFPDNVLVGGKDGLVLLDFEQASDGILAYDLAVLLLSWCWTGRALDGDLTRAMIAGYQATRPLAPGERQGLLGQARFCAVRFTVTRLTDVELNPDASPEIKNIKNYRDFYARLRYLRGVAEL